MDEALNSMVVVVVVAGTANVNCPLLSVVTPGTPGIETATPLRRCPPLVAVSVTPTVLCAGGGGEGIVGGVGVVGDVGVAGLDEPPQATATHARAKANGCRITASRPDIFQGHSRDI
jgi:hypothetical protein